MKKFIKTISAVTLSLILILSCFMISASAAATTSVAFSVNTPKVGDSVTVTVRLNAGEAIYSVDGSVTYNPAVLQYVSGASSASGSTLRFVDSFAGEQSISYNLIFKTIAEGASDVSFSMQYVGASLTKTSATGASAKLTVKNPAPVSSAPPVSSEYVKSNNANLSSLSVSGAALSPAFSKNVTEYTATVENSVASVTISAGKSNNKATVSGTGDVALQVGDNPFAITVTAEDGTKKTYNITIRRATVEETIALNPLATVIGGQMHHIVSDLTDVPIPAGFVLGTTTYNGKEISVLKTEDATYTLYRISRDVDGYVDYYVYKAHRDEFVKLQYMTVNDAMYIFAELPENYVVPEGYYETAATLGDSTVKAFCSENEALKDFYVIYCFANGSEGFYRFDTAQTSIQRAPDFSVIPEEPVKEDKNLIELFMSCSLLERILLCTNLAFLIATVTLAVILILKAKSRKSAHEYEDPIDDNDMVDFFKAAGKHGAADDMPVLEEDENMINPSEEAAADDVTEETTILE